MLGSIHLRHLQHLCWLEPEQAADMSSCTVPYHLAELHTERQLQVRRHSSAAL